MNRFKASDLLAALRDVERLDIKCSVPLRIYLACNSIKESNYDHKIKNASSSATGLHQMTYTTFRGPSSRAGLNEMKNYLSADQRYELDKRTRGLGLPLDYHTYSRGQFVKAITDKIFSHYVGLAHLKYVLNLIDRQGGTSITFDNIYTKFALAHRYVHHPSYAKLVMQKVKQLRGPVTLATITTIAKSVSSHAEWRSDTDKVAEIYPLMLQALEIY